MKHRFMALIAAMAFACVAILSATPALAKEKCVIAWSHYVGWEPLQYMKDSGLLKKWGDKYNVELDITPPMDYVESINQYTAKSFCALAVTTMDALANPAIGGVGATFVVIGDYSKGNDGLLAKSKNPLSVKDIAGRAVVLVENTVSHYLLWRALAQNGLPLTSVKTVNVSSETDVLNAVNTGKEGSFAITWNPVLMQARGFKDTQLIFTSAQTPGEIIDGIVVQDGTSDAVKAAIVGAWYEAVTKLSQPGPERDLVVKALAASSGTSVGEYNAQLETTYLFFTSKEAADFAEQPALKGTMNLVRQFVFEIGLFQGAKNADVVGIQFPDGSVVGDPENIKLRFETKFLRKAAEGTL